MEYLTYQEHPELRQPILITGFGGWGDASEVATWSAKFLVKQWDATKFAEIDAEEFFVFTEQRPQAKWEGDERIVTWPSTEFFYHRFPGGDHDFIVCVGVEPHLRWKTFVRTFCSFVQDNRIAAVVTLGGLLAAVPHTQSARVTGTATDPDLIDRLSEIRVNPGRYEGPTGIVGVLNSTLQQEHVPNASLWGNVPHYLSAGPNIKVGLAMLRQLNRSLRVDLDLSRVERQAARFETQVDKAVAENAEVSAYVRKLEEEQGYTGEEAQQQPREELPSGEALVRDLEEYLRQRMQNPDPPEDEERRQ